MDTAKYCQHCGKPLSGKDIRGLCPECMLKVGLGSSMGPAGPGEKKRFPAPTISEVAKLFPQLQILQILGQGGMGAVYKARQPVLDRLVALKILPPEPGSDPDFAERFTREARALARLSHPNIVAVYEFGEAGGLHFFIMEFVDGVNLRQLEESGKLSSRDALKIIPQICEALQFAHDEGIVHRDIKPENVLVDKKGRVKIADFGLAKILGREPEALRLTGAKDLMGTPHYMAPEQVEHPQAVDHRADIYSLGVVFYEMLTGELPLGKFQPPSKKVQVDVRLDEVVMHTLEKEPERRYQHASDVKSDVETIVTSTPSAAFRRAAAEGVHRLTVKDLFLFGIVSGCMPLLVTRAGGRKIYWPGVLLFCSTLGLVIYFVLFLFALGGWVFGAHWRLFQAGEWMLAIELVAACVVMRLAALKLSEKEMWKPAPFVSRGQKLATIFGTIIVAGVLGLAIASGLTSFRSAWAGIFGSQHSPGKPANAAEGVEVASAKSPQLATQASSIPDVPPVIVRTVPQAGAASVDPALSEIRVTFSRDMLTNQMWAFCKVSEETFPIRNGEPYFLDNQRTCVLPVKLEPGRTYALWLNQGENDGFRDTRNQASVPYLLIFETRK
jgi:predicted Ser/Thr protein kinase